MTLLALVTLTIGFGAGAVFPGGAASRAAVNRSSRIYPGSVWERRVMGLLFINILLALLWSALTGQFTLENLFTTGFILGMSFCIFCAECLAAGSISKKARSAALYRFLCLGID
jgi:hypothetical protein